MGAPAAEPTTSLVKRRGTQTALSFVLALAAVFVFLRQSPDLYDTDSYYHLAVARAYGAEGVLHDLRWTRFSVMAQGFGDKELLFHLLLAPFAGRGDVLFGGQVFLALLLACLFSLLTFLAHPVLGRYAVLFPFALVWTSTEFAWRLVRLRPELLSLFLLAFALWAAARGRYRVLGAVALVYTLSYTAFHALLGLCVLLFAVEVWSGHRRPWPLLLYPGLGTGLGLLLHPHLPHNLTVWVLQSFDFFAHKGVLDVGSEIRPNFTDVTLMVNLGYFLALWVLWRSTTADPDATETTRRDCAASARAFAVAAAVFVVLYLLMSRFSLYAIPFTALAVLYGLRARGRAIGARTRLPFGRQAPLGALLVLCALVSLPEAWRQAASYRRRTDPGPGEIRLTDRVDTARALPRGARVAARWQQTPVYMLWAPHALYLNALDPVFQARTFPDVFDAQARLFAGRDPDVPLTLVTQLDSDYLAFSRAADTGRLRARLEADPRVSTLHSGINEVYRALAHRNSSFVLDWSRVPESLPLPPPVGSADDDWPSYPWHPEARGAAVEGFVDGRRLRLRNGCIALSRREEGPGLLHFELAPWGPTRLWLDERLVVETGTSLEAVLGRGLIQTLPLAPGRHRLTVWTCQDAPGSPLGFYFRRDPK